MSDKHMLFLIKKDLVLSGQHRLRGYTAKAEHGRTQHPQKTLLWPGSTTNHCAALVFSPHASYRLVQNRAENLPFSALPLLNRSVLTDTTRGHTMFSA